jgi:hypothetical protein
MNKELADAAVTPVVLQTGSPGEVDEYLVRALWHDQTPSLTPAVVSHWATLLRRRGRRFASHASACHYWLYDKLSGDSDGPPAVLQTGTPAEVDEYLVGALWQDHLPSLIPAVVSGWATLLHRRGLEFASHASACHYWLYEKLSGEPEELPVGHPGRSGDRPHRKKSTRLQ